MRRKRLKKIRIRMAFLLLVCLILPVFCGGSALPGVLSGHKMETDIEKKVSAAVSKKNSFYIKKINSAIFSRIKGKSFKKNCTLPKKDLRYVHILHKNLEGETLKGELICNKYIAKRVLKIFKKLYQAGYPVERVKLIDEYDADDELSMEDNNSSSFNFRFISHTKRVSKHGLGLAVDINTLYNPYVKMVRGKKVVEPVTAKKYTNRSLKFSYKIEKNDLAYRLFKKYGFEWGGDWKNSKDYQHFEMPDAVVRRLYR